MAHSLTPFIGTTLSSLINFANRADSHGGYPLTTSNVRSISFSRIFAERITISLRRHVIDQEISFTWDALLDIICRGLRRVPVAMFFILYHLGMEHCIVTRCLPLMSKIHINIFKMLFTELDFSLLEKIFEKSEWREQLWEAEYELSRLPSFRSILHYAIRGTDYTIEEVIQRLDSIYCHEVKTLLC